MENNPLKEKETKRRFFRRTGLARAQRSLDSSSPVPSHSPSFENPAVLAHANNPGTASSSPLTGVGPPGSRNFSGRTGGGSSSLDESVISNKMDQHRRFMAAPRRARSAERFDGMRVAFNSPGDEMAPRNFRSPQLVRNGTGSIASVGGVAPISEVGRSAAHTPTMPSPPPPYSSAITDITGPPSYRQAVAAMTTAAQAQQQSKGKSIGARYTMPHRGTQSFDTSVVGMPSGATLRSASSVPAFSDEVICNCSKCQVLQRPNEMGYGEYNDAVYMESQAFLMHEIMTDGMAFCSVM